MFNIKPYKEDCLTTRMFGDGSYRDDDRTGEIFIYWHGDNGEDLAFRVCVYDVIHECFHDILANFISEKVCIDYDCELGCRIDRFLNEKTFKDFEEKVKKSNRGYIRFGVGDKHNF